MQSIAGFPEIRVLGERQSTAARDHTCAVCGYPIKEGEAHRRVAMIDKTARSKRFRTMRYHIGKCPS